MKRARLRVVVLVGCAGSILGVVTVLWSAVTSHAASVPVYVFPIPGGRVAAPSTQITFRGVPAGQLGLIGVRGSASGEHTGRILADSDGMGASFLPTKPFKAGEKVTLTTDLNVVGGKGGSFSFTIATPAGRIRAAATVPAKRVRGDVSRFVSRPDLVPTAVTVTKQPAHAAAGDIFVAAQDGPVQDGPMILGPHGGLIWYKALLRNESATDFRTQTYQGKPVLTWWQGTVSAAGVGEGEDEIYNTAYQPMATVRAGNGLRSDLHEFQLTSENTALVTAYYAVYWKASSAKQAKREVVLDAVAQEIDIPTGLVLYQWDSLDHVPLGDSYQPAPTTGGHPWDYFHINSIQQAADGNLIVSSRDTWTVYNLSHQTGAIRWRLGGKHSSFKMGKNTSFAFQHDARLQANNLITIFDDGAGPPVVHSQSRGLTLRLDTRHMTATLVRQDEHHPALLAAYEGSVQPQINGDDLVGWGQQPYVTEFNSRGQTVFDARYIGPNTTYRAYRFPWSGSPASPPAIAVRRKGAKTTVYVSWDGATKVAKWNILSGAGPASLKVIAKARQRAFETAIASPGAAHYLAAQALDAHGQVLASSRTIVDPR